MNFQKIFDQVDSIKGWMGREDLYLLYQYVAKLKNALIVEIGPYAGRSTKLMALASPTSHIVAIDPYVDKPAYQEYYDHQKDTQEAFRIHLEGLNAVLIHSTAGQARRNWVAPIDFLHIDGDHHYKAVIEDIENFVPFVKSGHYVFLHDMAVIEEGLREGAFEKGLITNPNYGVKRAVNLLGGKYFSKVKEIDGFAVCKKL